MCLCLSKLLYLLSMWWKLDNRPGTSQKKCFGKKKASQPLHISVYPRKMSQRNVTNDPPPPREKNKSWTHMIAVDCTNRISLVASSGCRSSQNNTVLICFGNSSKILRRNVSTIRWLAIAPCPKMSEETHALIHFIDLHLARDSFETD